MASARSALRRSEVGAIHFDQYLPDDERRQAIYRGEIFVYSPRAATETLCALGRAMIREAFAPLDPQTVDRHLSMEETVRILAKVKPAFIHHPDCNSLVPRIVEEIGGDLSKVYFDVPRMRSAYPAHYLTSGIAYAFHAHRDTWYSAPMCQINWWLPIFDITPQNCMAIYPENFSSPVENSSEIYDYGRWNRDSRANAAKHVRSDTREQPKPTRAIESEDIRLICPPGAMILFSAAQLHATVPNASAVARYSIDFRTVHIDDVLAHRGARNLDSRCTGTTMRDYLRCTDLQHIPEAAIHSYEGGTEIAERVPGLAADMVLGSR
jgi:hypothetical protein